MAIIISILIILFFIIRGALQGEELAQKYLINIVAGIIAFFFLGLLASGQ